MLLMPEVTRSNRDSSKIHLMVGHDRWRRDEYAIDYKYHSFMYEQQQARPHGLTRASVCLCAQVQQQQQSAPVIKAAPTFAPAAMTNGGGKVMPAMPDWTPVAGAGRLELALHRLSVVVKASGEAPAELDTVTVSTTTPHTTHHTRAQPTPAL